MQAWEAEEPEGKIRPAPSVIIGNESETCINAAMFAAALRAAPTCIRQRPEPPTRGRVRYRDNLLREHTPL